MKGGYSSVSSRACPTSRTSNTPWSTAPSSPSTKRRAAQRGDPEPGHRRSRGGLTTKILALVDALGNLKRGLVFGNPHSVIGLLCACFDFALNDKTGIDGVLKPFGSPMFSGRYLEGGCGRVGPGQELV